MSTGTQSLARSVPSPLRLAILWFGIQLAWGAVLGISLQARTLHLAGASALAVYGTISTIGALAAAFAQVIVAPSSDARRARGDKRIGYYVAGSSAAAVAIVAFYVAPSVPTFAIAYVVLQLAMNVAIGPYQAILPDVVPSAKLGSASAWMAAMQSAGNAAGAILATLLGASPMLGFAIGAVLLASCALTALHLRDVPLQPIAQERALRIDRTLVDLFISRALVYVGFYTLLGYFYFYVRGLVPAHGPVDATTAAGLCVLLFTLVGAIGAALAAKPADRMDERLVVTIGGGVVALGTLGLAVLHHVVVAPVAIGVAGIGWGIFLSADWAYACRLLPRGALARMMALWNVAIVGPQMLAPALTTVILSSLHLLQASIAPNVAFGLAAVEILLGTAWIWRLPQQRRG